MRRETCGSNCCGENRLVTELLAWPAMQCHWLQEVEKLVQQFKTKSDREAIFRNRVGGQDVSASSKSSSRFLRSQISMFFWNWRIQLLEVDEKRTRDILWHSRGSSGWNRWLVDSFDDNPCSVPVLRPQDGDVDCTISGGCQGQGLPGGGPPGCC